MHCMLRAPILTTMLATKPAAYCWAVGIAAQPTSTVHGTAALPGRLVAVVFSMQINDTFR